MTVNNGGLAKANSGTINALPLFYRYRYDQLNRIKCMQTYKGLSSANSWTPIAIDDYKESTTYDPNGNIITYNRKGAPEASMPLQMDDLSYDYTAGTNKLKHVGDNAGYSGNYSADIDNQSNATNYTYDKIGNLTADVSENISAIDWSVYGKIKSISKSSGGITYTYDAAGNRVSKTTGTKRTIYVRDASGNVMAVYESISNGEPVQTESHIYGSSRTGMATTEGTVPFAPNDAGSVTGNYGSILISTFTRGEKIYELTNHLGNVLATVSDRRQQVPLCNRGGVNCIIEHYEADVLSASDYYPFGMQMPGRTYNAANAYRYGFNGKEKDNDGPVQYDYGFRIYDPRLVRFKSVDPLQKKFPELTPYQFSSNNPIDGIDLDGRERIDYRAAKEDDGTVKLKYLSTGPKSERTSSTLWLKVMSIPAYIRVEYNGGHFAFADGRNNYSRIKVDIGGFGDVYYMSQYFEFLKNPDGFSATHRSIEDANEEFRTEVVVRTAIALSEKATEGIISSMGAGKISRGRYTPSEQTNEIATAANNGNLNSAASNSASSLPSASADNFIRTETIGGNKAARTVGENIINKKRTRISPCRCS